MTPEQIKAIKERAEKATPGPWIVSPDNRPDIFTTKPGGYFGKGQIIKDLHKGAYWLPTQEWKLHVAEFSKYENANVDADFVSHAREDIPELLDYIEELQSALDAFGPSEGH